MLPSSGLFRRREPLGVCLRTHPDIVCLQPTAIALSSANARRLSLRLLQTALLCRLSLLQWRCALLFRNRLTDARISCASLPVFHESLVLSPISLWVVLVGSGRGVVLVPLRIAACRRWHSGLSNHIVPASLVEPFHFHPGAEPLASQIRAG
ncbi:hypothetical protein BDZ45DRAFT_775561 [Acephala macrosclerotiorum]|nr:hypothetical protein BDZ45DRAFT_775561 [Acephala macrosclerotiorum]